MIVRIVAFCTRRSWPVVALAALMAIVSAVYAATHFAITTDITKLIANDLPWTQRQAAFFAAFRELDILVVVRAPTSELVEQARDALAQRLAAGSPHVRSVRQPGGGAFFERNGFLYLSTEQLERTTYALTKADQLLATLAEDPSLRGIMDVISFAVTGVRNGEVKLDVLAWPLGRGADMLEDVFAGRPARPRPTKSGRRRPTSTLPANSRRTCG